MNRQNQTLFVLAIFALTSIAALAAEVKVIANLSVQADSVTADDLKRVFLEGASTLRDGSHVGPVLAKGGAAHEAFVRDYLGSSDAELQMYYRSLVFTGKGSMPKVLGSDAEVAQYVAKTKGAIGYVSATTNVEGVKTLIVEPPENLQARVLLTRTEPEYPEVLQRLHVGGVVRLKLTISPKGRVEEVALLGGNPILAEAAITAVKQWIYATSSSTSSVIVNIPFTPPS